MSALYADKHMAKKLSFTRKYRPKTTKNYIGNDALINKLNKLHELDKLPQTILFNGLRGTGKTTLARLEAKNLLCLEPVDGKACEQCTHCQQLDEKFIEEGVVPRNIPVFEYKINELNKREDAQEIVNKMSKRSVMDNKRVFILDEIQRATKEAQSTFLKIVEEPPEDLYIILCTTDIEDLLVPFKSRFFQFKIQKPKTEDLVKQLSYICEEEGIDYSKDGLRLIAKHTSNIPRESINLLEIIGATNKITRKTVEEELYLISRLVYMNFLDACKKANLGILMTAINELKEKNQFTVQDFVKGLGEFFVDLLNLRSGISLDLYSESDIRDLRKYIKTFTENQIVDILKVLKTYSNIKSDDTYHLLALGSELIEILNIEEELRVPNETHINSEYVEVTNNIKKSKVADKLKAKPQQTTEEDVNNIFRESTKLERDIVESPTTEIRTVSPIEEQRQTTEEDMLSLFGEDSKLN